MEEETLSKKEKRALAKEKKSSDRLKSSRSNTVKVWGVVLIIIGLIGYGGWRLWTWIQTPIDLPEDVTMVSESDWIRGNADSELTLIEYGDFQCPACGSYAPLVKQVEEEFPETLKVVFRHFPLTSIHPNAYPASQAAEAAGRQGKFWEMHDKLFETQKEWSLESKPEEYFERYAEELELNLEQFKSDYKSSEVSDAIAVDIALGNQTGINATPTFILNGQQIRAPQSLEGFKALIESAQSPQN